MFMDLIRGRRSIRKFAARPIEKEKLDLLIEAALRSPSSRSLNPWQFIVVTDPEKLEQLSISKPHGASFLKGAPLGIIVIADPERCDVWIEDASIASIFIQLAAESIGLKSCWIQIRKRFFSDTVTAEEKVKEFINIPDNFNVESIIAVGYPDESKEGHNTKNLSKEKIHFESFGK